MNHKTSIIALMMCLCLSVQSQTPGQIQAYINQYKDIALRQEQLYHVPASITIAQGILESGAGTSGLTRNSNNHFGIKGSSSWKGGIYKAWDDEPQKSSFRCYPSAAASYEDHARLLCNSHYQRFVGGLPMTDYVGWAYGLKRAGYATAPNYAEALIGYIDAYHLYTLNKGVRIPNSYITQPQKKKRKVMKWVKVPVNGTNMVENVQVEEDEEVESDESYEEFNINEFYKRKYVVEINGISVTRIYPGEDLASIARRYDIPINKLLKFNDLQSASQLQEGDIVYLAKKKSKYTGPQDYHIVINGETIHGISQKFGIQKQKLMKLNRFNSYTKLAQGDKVLIK